MTRLQLESLQVDTFSTTAGTGDTRGTVAAHEAAIDTVRNCPYSYGGTCVISGCLPCYTDDPCN